MEAWEGRQRASKRGRNQSEKKREMEKKKERTLKRWWIRQKEGDKGGRDSSVGVMNVEGILIKCLRGAAVSTPGNGKLYTNVHSLVTNISGMNLLKSRFSVL